MALNSGESKKGGYGSTDAGSFSKSAPKPHVYHHHVAIVPLSKTGRNKSVLKTRQIQEQEITFFPPDHYDIDEWHFEVDYNIFLCFISSYAHLF